jgi:hypothetical protein
MVPNLFGSMRVSPTEISTVDTVNNPVDKFSRLDPSDVDESGAESDGAAPAA